MEKTHYQPIWWLEKAYSEVKVRVTIKFKTEFIVEELDEEAAFHLACLVREEGH